MSLLTVAELTQRFPEEYTVVGRKAHDDLPRFGFGIEFDMPDAVYRAYAGIPQSTLKEMALSPAHYMSVVEKDRDRVRQSKLNVTDEVPEPAPEDDERNEAMDLGVAVHTAVLEPGRFTSAYIVLPEEINLRTKGGKMWRDAVEKEGTTVLKPETHALIASMREAIMAHPIARLAVETSRHEVSVFAPISVGGVVLQRKGRVDCVSENGIALSDIKTVRRGANHPDHYGRVIGQRMYHLQAAWYLDLMNAVVASEQFTEFVHLTVESSPPFAVACYRLDRDAIDAGRALYTLFLQRVAECTESGVWPAYPTALLDVSVSKWALNRAFVS